jgi:hypothetical protein
MVGSIASVISLWIRDNGGNRTLDPIKEAILVRHTVRSPGKSFNVWHILTRPTHRPQVVNFVQTDLTADSFFLGPSQLSPPQGSNLQPRRFG